MTSWSSRVVVVVDMLTDPRLIRHATPAVAVSRRIMRHRE